MDRTIDDLVKEVENLKQIVVDQSTILTKLILIINLSNTDLKDYLHILES